MAEPKDKELTPKEIAMQHFTGKTSSEGQGDKEEPTEDELKLKAEADAKILAEKEESDKLKLAEEEKEKAKKEKKVEVAEMSDSDLLAMVAKRSGREIKSWDELKPLPAPEDKKKIEDARDADKLSYGLQKGLFNKNTYESFIADSKDRIGLVYRAELEDAKKDDPTWDEEKEKEFKDEFDEKFGLTLDPTSPMYKRGQKRLAVISDSILKSTYAPIYNLDNEFDKYETGVNNQKQEQQKILSEAPMFKQDLHDVLEEISTVSSTMGADKFEIPVPKEIKDEVQELLLDQKFVTSQILKGHKKEELSLIALNIIKNQHFDYFMFEAAKKYREKHEKGTKGITQPGTLEKTGDQYESLTDNQKKAITYFQPKTVAN